MRKKCYWISEGKIRGCLEQRTLLKNKWRLRAHKWQDGMQLVRHFIRIKADNFCQIFTKHWARINWNIVFNSIEGKWSLRVTRIYWRGATGFFSDKCINDDTGQNGDYCWSQTRGHWFKINSQDNWETRGKAFMQFMLSGEYHLHMWWRRFNRGLPRGNDYMVRNICEITGVELDCVSGSWYNVLNGLSCSNNSYQMRRQSSPNYSCCEFTNWI